MVCASLAKFAQDLVLLMSNEVGEVLEPYLPGRGASSTMPQKRNPMSSEVILANARHVRQAAGLCMEAAVQDFERATGPWMSEWTAIPDAFLYTAGSLAQAKFLLAGLEVKTDRMRENLAASGGLIVAEAVMMALAPHLGRDHAHHLVADACRQALAENKTLDAVLQSMPEVLAHLSVADIKHSCDPSNYLGAAPEMVDSLLRGRS
jgi:3-carboxy-cis,cis-muconate cycloisomerase